MLQTVTVSNDPPPAMPLGVSDAGAIQLCRDWMVHLGASDTVVASGSVRTVCDLFSRQYLAWVDNGRSNLEAAVVDHAVRVASSDGRQPMIFKRGGIRWEAQQLADSCGVALFSFVPSDGLLEGANPLGYQLRASGLST